MHITLQLDESCVFVFLSSVGTQKVNFSTFVNLVRQFLQQKRYGLRLPYLFDNFFYAPVVGVGARLFQ